MDSVAELDGWVVDLIQSGRRSRAIYSVEALHRAPGMLRDRALAGEHVRILTDVPSRLGVFGSTTALYDEGGDGPQDTQLVLRQPSLVTVFTLPFEALWEKALVVPVLEGQRYDEGTSGQRLLLRQLAGGAKDEQVARSLGVSVRTVRRRVAELLEELGAESRFQAGVAAVRRGWL